MNIYQSVVDYLSELPLVRSWPELRELLGRAAEMEPRDWQLPFSACEAVGGSAGQAVPAAAAIACAQISIIFIDDLLDEDPRGEYRQVGPAQAANYAAAFQATGLEAFFLKGMQSSIRFPALRCLDQMMMTVAFGQHLDVRNPSDESSYWQVVENKSASFFGAALKLGALTGGASFKVANGLERFGRLYGEMIQIHDDLNDTMAVPANPDWIQGRSPLPILFAQLVDHPARPRFMELRQAISQAEALNEAQEILIHCGAVSYCVDQLLHRHQVAEQVLRNTRLVRRTAVEGLLRALVAPVFKLMEALNQSTPDVFFKEERGSSQ